VTDVDYCRLEEFQEAYPEWKDIGIGEIVSDRYYFYRRTSERNGGYFVQRYPKVYGREYYKSRFFERFMAKRGFSHPSQKRFHDIVTVRSMV